MHHKRKKPKSSRSGCLMCKPHKRQGSCLKHRQPHSVNRQIAGLKDQVRTYRCDEA